MNVCCNRAGLRYHPGSSLAVCYWRLRGEGPRVKQQPRSKIEPASRTVVRREAAGARDRHKPEGLRSGSKVSGGLVRLSKYRIPLDMRVMRSCLDTGQEQTPVARGKPRSCGASAPTECHDFVVDRELPTSGRVELEDSQRPDPRAAWCPPGSSRSGSLPLFRDPQLSIQLVPSVAELNFPSGSSCSCVLNTPFTSGAHGRRCNAYKTSLY